LGGELRQIHLLKITISEKHNTGENGKVDHPLPILADSPIFLTINELWW